MNEYRAVLERFATSAEPLPDPFQRLTARRRRKERGRQIEAILLVGVVAVVVVAGGLVIARSTTRPGASGQSTRSAQGFFWPATTHPSAEAGTFCCLQPEVAAQSFARVFLGWDQPLVRECEPSKAGACPTPPRNARTLYVFRGCLSCEGLVLHLERAPFGWGITHVTGSHVRLALLPSGGPVAAGATMQVTTDLPDGTTLIVGYGYRAPCGSVSFPSTITVKGGRIVFRVGTSGFRWSCPSSRGTNSVRSVRGPLAARTEGYVFVLRTPANAPPLHPIAPGRLVQSEILDLAAAPVVFVPGS